jgi:hypothetical protein
MKSARYSERWVSELGDTLGSHQKTEGAGQQVVKVAAWATVLQRVTE